METVALHLIELVLLLVVGGGVVKINRRNGSIEDAIHRLRRELPCAERGERIRALEQWKEDTS